MLLITSQRPLLNPSFVRKNEQKSNTGYYSFSFQKVEGMNGLKRIKDIKVTFSYYKLKIRILYC